MATSKPIDIPWPLSSFPGASTQESSGRLINCYAEPLGEAQAASGGKTGKPPAVVWHGAAGLSQHAVSGQTGYRGGLIVNNLSYECYANNASTVDVNGAVTSLGNFPGTKKVSIARNQRAPTADVVAVDLDNGAYILNTAALASATITATIAGTSLIAGDAIALSFANVSVVAFPVTVTYPIPVAASLTSIAAGIAALINANATLNAAAVSATSALGVVTISQQGSIANSTTLTAALEYLSTLTGTVTGSGNETVAIASAAGSSTFTIAGSSFVSGDTVAMTFTNTTVSPTPIVISHTLGAGESATSIATALKTAWNANATLSAAGITATSALGVVTINIGLGNETVTFAPAGGGMTGGTGTPGINFTGAPLAYNGGGNLPQPNGVTAHDSYFIFSIGDNRLFASGINALTQNSQTFTTCTAKATASLLRPITFSNLVMAMTTASIEVYQDTAQPFPAFPYTRLAVLDIGLLQANAIAGFEDGFSDLMWVAQDFGVYRMPTNSLGYNKVSPPDLDRLIEAQSKAGATLEAGVYVVAGKKFWALSSPSWTWEFNLSTQRWNERKSLGTGTITGTFGRWRATGGHPAFGKWLCGDTLSGNLLYLDDAANDENGAVLRMRLESGPVADFPNRMRVPRADFNFVTGVGQAARALTMNVSGAVSGTSNRIRLTVPSTARIVTGDTGQVAAITGTVDANGTWPLAVIDATHVELTGSAFVNAYISGGTLTDVTTPTNVQNPSVEIEWSDDGGNTWCNPRILALGQQSNTKNTRIPVKNTGMSGPQARRWRVTISDPVYRGFMGATQSTDPKDF